MKKKISDEAVGFIAIWTIVVIVSIAMLLFGADYSLAYHKYSELFRVCLQ